VNREIITHSEEETISAGKNFSTELKVGDVVALYGDLGSGKTRFVKGISMGFGVKERVTSPTFIVMNEHLDGKLPLYHFDFYRLKSLAELEEIGFDEYLFGNGVCVIEWADTVEKTLPASRYSIRFSYRALENERKIDITKS